MVSQAFRDGMQELVRQTRSREVLETLVACLKEEAQALSESGDKDNRGKKGDKHEDVVGMRSFADDLDDMVEEGVYV